MLGSDDRVSVSVRDVKEIEFKPALIDAAGNLELPYAGKLHAAGLTTGDLAKVVAERLKDYINDPHVTVEVTEYGSQPVSVIGAVNKPGVYQLRGRKTLMKFSASRKDCGTTPGIALPSPVGRNGDPFRCREPRPIRMAHSAPGPTSRPSWTHAAPARTSRSGRTT